jgi:hypothetical protein
MKNQNNNYEIVDLILPESIDKEKAKQKLNDEYASKFYYSHLNIENGWLENTAREYIRELEEIENSHPKYDRTVWEQVIELNKDNFRKMQTSLIVYNKFIYFEDYTVGRESLNFEMHELDLINKQYRLMQEIAYSRLEGK